MMAQWSAHEDELLRKLVKEYGPKRWSVIATKLKTKGSKQCRRRWKNHLNAELKSGGWSAEEDRILMEGHRLYGNRWTEIAKMVGGRTDNAVKNRYAALCKRDSRAPARGGGAGRGGRGGRKARVSDSDGGGSDEDVEVDDDSDGDGDGKRTSSSSVSREASPPRPTRAQGRGGGGNSASAASAAHSTPPKRGMPSGSPLVAAAAPPAAADGPGSDPGAGGSSGGGATTILGRRRQPPAAVAATGGNGSSTPPVQSDHDASAAAAGAPGPSKRRALMQASGMLSGGSSSSSASAFAGGRQQQLATPVVPPQQQPTPMQSEEALVMAQPQLQHHSHPQPQLYHHPQEHHPEQAWQSGAQMGITAGGGQRVLGPAAGAAAPAPVTCWDRTVVTEMAQQPVNQQRPCSWDGTQGHDGVSGVAVGGSVQPKKLPLTINIPNAASAEPAAQPPPTSAATGYGIEIRVLKDLLTPCEMQYVRELNEMQLPLHINVEDDDPGSLLITRPSGGTSAGLLCAGSSAAPPATYADPPLTTSRQAAQNAISALFSPGCVTASAMADFNDVLKWFQTGLTPRSTYGSCGGAMGGDEAGGGGTPRLLSRLGMTSCGGGRSVGGRVGCDDDAGPSMLGTGLTPKCLLQGGGDGGSSPRSHGGCGLTPQLSEAFLSTPSKRAQRQIAVAAAVAAAAQEEPNASSIQHQGPPPGQETPGGGASGLGCAGLQGLFSPAAGGMEFHAGHRQLLTKLFQTAVSVDAGGGTGACALAAKVGGGAVPSRRLEESQPRIAPPSPSGSLLRPCSPFESNPAGALARQPSGSGGQAVATAIISAAGPSGDTDGGNAEPAGCALGVGQGQGQAGAGGVVVMPYFSQQELMMLLEVLNSDDMSVLPPAPSQ